MRASDPVLMILVDAFPRDYLSKKYTPYLHFLAKEGSFFPISPMFAFRGIEATIFTGVGPNTHKIWTEFSLRESELHKTENDAKSLFFKNTLKALDVFPSYALKRVTRHFYYRIIKKDLMPAMIPADLLDYFESSQPAIFSPNFLAVSTLFDILREKGLDFKFLAPPVEHGDKNIFNKTINALGKESHDFWFIKFGGLDPLGHTYGPFSGELKNRLNVIDGYINKICSRFKARYPSASFLLLSDHGMVEVKKTINLIQKLKKLNLKMPRDFVMFLDSTMVRFWFFNQGAKEKIMEELSHIEDGHVLNLTELKQLAIEEVGHHYGEEIFVLDEGRVFFPDFFRWNLPPKGMHGYASESSKPILISNNGGLNNRLQIEFKDLMPTTLKLLNLDIPWHCEGASLLV